MLMWAPVHLSSGEAQPPPPSRAAPRPGRASSHCPSQPRWGPKLALIGKTPPTANTPCPHFTSGLTFRQRTRGR